MKQLIIRSYWWIINLIEGPVDVCKAPWHADNEGLMDSTDAINQAVASSNPYQTIILRPGTYLVTSTICLKAGSTLMGTGRQTTIIFK